jgi:hypothetical protein
MALVLWRSGAGRYPVVRGFLGIGVESRRRSEKLSAVVLKLGSNWFD